MSRFRWITVVIVAVLVLLAGLPVAASPAIGNQPSPPGQEAPGAFLTGSNLGDALDIALAFLAGSGDKLGLSAGDLNDLMVTDRYTTEHNGVTHIYLRQRHAGIEVFNANVNINIARDGSVISMGQSLVPGLAKAVNSSVPALSAADAVAAAAESAGLKLSQPLEQLEASGGADQAVLFNDGGISLDPIPARLVYQPAADGSVRLAWNVTIYQLDALHWWDMRVDAQTGKVLDQIDYVIHDDFGAGAPAPSSARSASLADRWIAAAQPEVGGGTYRVYGAPVESPSHGSRSLVSDPANALASPYGWHDTNGASGAEYTTTQGNNAHAYTDTDNNNSPDAGSSPNGGSGLSFDLPLDLGQAPSAYRPAAVTNLFYWNNLVHDVMYQYGFNEASGNFQENNYGRGGSASDYVYAEAQDGGGTNNANFATNVDGINPRMQMYVWNYTSPNRDGDFDNGIIVHEYGHGISTRLTGGPGTASCLNNTEQMGEGWSDFFGILMTIEPGDAGTDRRGVGTYALGQATTGNGIRSYPYSTNMSIDPRTYNEIKTAAVPHGVGSTWTAMVWEMTWALIDQYGFDPNLYTGTGGNNIALRLVTDGLKLQPCSPGFVDGRNAILQADQVNSGGANQCLIWNAFAKRGLGYSASQGSSGSRSDGVEAYDVPPACLANLKITKSASPATATAGQSLTYSLLVENQTASTLNNVTITDNVPAGTVYAGAATCSGSETGGMVTFNLGTMNAGASQTCSFNVTVNPGSGTITYFADDMESGSNAWDTSGSGSTWSLGTANAHSPTHAWFAQDVSSITDQYLATTSAVALSGSPVLSFWHNYATETNYDGGVVEISANGGPWTDLGSLITQNGYNSTISTSYGSPIGGRQAFSGNSGGYVETKINLSSYAGSSVQVRFRMATDSSVSSTGWYVDDVTISDAVSVSNTACVSATGGHNDCDTINTTVLPGTGSDDPPTVTITSPANGSTVNGNVTVTANATDDNGVTQVEFFVDGSSIGVDTNEGDGWSVAWDTTESANGSHSVSATVTDTNNQTANDSVGVTVNNVAPDSPPSVSITYPTNGGTVSGSVTVTANANDDNGVTQVEFFVDGSSIGVDTNGGDGWSVAWDTTQSADGGHSVSATATDTIGQTGGDSVAVTVDNTVPSGEVIYVSSSTGGSAGGVSFQDEDILSYNTATSAWAMVFDGSDVGVTADLNAFRFRDDGSILMSFQAAVTIGSLGLVDDSDVVRFIPTSLGNNTAGAFEMYFDGSDVGLTTNGEDIDGFSVLYDGTIIITTVGSFNVPGASGADEDMVAFTPTSLGDNTSGSWSFFFDGSDVGLGGTRSGDVVGAWFDPFNDEIYMSTLGDYSLPGASGDGADIFICTPISLGSSTNCTFRNYWDGSAFGFAGEVVDGMSIQR